MRAGTVGIEKKLPAFTARRVPSPDRVPRKEAYEQTWGWLSLGSLRLEAGTQRLVLEPLNEPEILKIKIIALERMN